MFKSPEYRTIMGCLLAAIVLNSSIAALNAAQAEELFTINTADKPPFSTINNDGIYDKIILRLFEDMGAQIRINHLLSARSIENVQVGLDDAEYARIKGLSEKYKQKVLEP